MIKTRGLLSTVLICKLKNITHNFFFISEVTRLLSQFYLIFLLRNGLRHYRSIAIRDRSRISQLRDLHVHKSMIPSAPSRDLHRASQNIRYVLSCPVLRPSNTNNPQAVHGDRSLRRNFFVPVNRTPKSFFLKPCF